MTDYHGAGSDTAAALGELTIAFNHLDQSVRMLLSLMANVPTSSFQVLTADLSIAQVIRFLEPLAAATPGHVSPDEAKDLSKRLNVTRIQRNGLVHGLTLVTADDKGYSLAKGRLGDPAPQIVSPEKLREAAEDTRSSRASVDALIGRWVSAAGLGIGPAEAGLPPLGGPVQI